LLDEPVGGLAVLVVALVIDRVFGEPPPRAHPVVWIGALTTALLRFAPATGAVAQLLYGSAVALTVPLAAVAATHLVLGALSALPGTIGATTPLATVPLGLVDLVLRAWLLKTLFAVSALGDAARGVRVALVQEDLGAAREGLRSLCSRDPSRLDAKALTAATIESVAENASDSIFAPLFYFLVLGLPATAGYRAINTLDAMIGYRGRYEHLGKAAARLDDLANLVPARLTAALLLAGGALAGADARRGWRVLRRDGGLTESPNAGRPMAAMAGLLAVRLEKAGHYRLGDALEPLDPAKIEAAWRIVRRALGIAVASASLVLAVLQLGA
jgi:adenosylcobinamide-phosphate synthase